MVVRRVRKNDSIKDADDAAAVEVRSIDAQKCLHFQTEIHVCNFIPNHVRNCTKWREAEEKEGPFQVNKYIGLAWNTNLVAPSVVANHSMYETIMFIQCKCWLPSYCAHTVCLFFNFVCLLHKNVQRSVVVLFFLSFSNSLPT